MMKMVFAFFAAAIAIYVPVSLFMFSRLVQPLKIAGMAFCLFVSFKWLFVLLLKDHVSYTATLALETLFNAFLCMFVFLILIDLAHLACHFLAIRCSCWQTLKWLACIPALATGFAGMMNAAALPETREITIHIKNLPENLKNFRIAQISDLHLQKNMNPEWLFNVIQLVNDQKPDITVITGDIGDGDPDEIRFLSLLGDLKARHGVYSISGNHEFYSGYEKWVKAMERIGIPMLENRGETVAPGLEIYGVADVLPIYPATAPDKEIRIGLAHRPLAAIPLSETSALVLSGHTHGGQVAGIMRSLVARNNGGMTNGLYDKIYVNAGTGLWRGFMFRLGVSPEITVITLEPESHLH